MPYDWTRRAVDPRGCIVAPRRVEWLRLARGEKCCICGRAPVSAAPAQPNPEWF